MPAREQNKKQCGGRDARLQLELQELGTLLHEDPEHAAGLEATPGCLDPCGSSLVRLPVDIRQLLLPLVPGTGAGLAGALDPLLFQHHLLRFDFHLMRLLLLCLELLLLPLCLELLLLPLGLELRLLLGPVLSHELPQSPVLPPNRKAPPGRLDHGSGIVSQRLQGPLLRLGHLQGPLLRLCCLQRPLPGLRRRRLLLLEGSNVAEELGPLTGEPPPGQKAPGEALDLGGCQVTELLLGPGDLLD